MIAYRGIPYQPVLAQRLTPQRLYPGRLAQAPADAVRAIGMPAALGLTTLNLALEGATAWVGITMGKQSSGLLSAAGWVVGILGVVGALSSVLTLGGIVFGNGNGNGQPATEPFVGPQQQ